MTVTDRADATEQEFRDRIAAFETAPTPPEVREAAVLEEVEEATRRHFGDDYRGPFAPIDGATKLAQAKFRAGYRAAVAAYRAQDGGAEEAVRRVEALAYESGSELSDVDPDGLDDSARAQHLANISLHTKLCLALWGSR